MNYIIGLAAILFLIWWIKSKLGKQSDLPPPPSNPAAPQRGAIRPDKPSDRNDP